MTMPKLSHEPAIYVAVAGGLIALLVAFGVPITPEKKEAIIGFIPLIGAVIVRQNVVSSARLEDHNISPETLKKIDPTLPSGVAVAPVVPPAAVVALLLAVGASLMLSACGGNTPPVTQPNAVMQVTGGADAAVKAADAALPVIESLTPNPIPRKTTLAIAKATEGIGHGAQSLATVLDAYVKSRGVDDWTKVQGAIAGINKALDAALSDVPEPTRTQIRGILQPVTAALLAILTTTPPPVAARVSMLLPAVTKFPNVQVGDLFIDTLVAADTIGVGGRFLIADRSILDDGRTADGYFPIEPISTPASLGWCC